MNLTLNDDQRMIRESADTVLADIAGSAQTRAAMALADGFDAGIWQHISQELGWCAIAVPEAAGGLGLGAVELVQLFEPMGHHLLCAPYFSTVALATSVLLRLADEPARQHWLPKIAAGEITATAPMPVADGAGWIAARSNLAAVKAGDQWMLSGTLDGLADGAIADLLLLPAVIDDGGAPAWFAVQGKPAGLQRQATASWDRTRRFADLRLDAVEAQRIDDAALPETASRQAVAIAQLCLAAEQLGGAQACLDLTVAYTATRKQFGRAIAGFQAVKHRCAEMMVAIEGLRSAVYGAAAVAVDDDADVDDFALDAAMALAQSKVVYFHCAQEAIQLHGGVGFTWEYDPQLHFKRAQAGSHWMGTASALRASIADQVMA